MDNAYVLNDVVQGRLKEGKVILFAYDTVWHDGWWLKLWEMAFSKEVEFKRYLHGVSDAGTRLLFKFRSGTHGLNEELSRHRQDLWR